MSLQLRLVSSMEKCFFDENIFTKKECSQGSALLGEEYAFEVLFTDDDPEVFSRSNLLLRVESDLCDAITVRKVEPVPVRQASYAGVDDNYLRKTPGLYPDLLSPLDSFNHVFPRYGDLQALWVSVKVPENAAPGDHRIDLVFRDENKMKEALASGLPVTDSDFIVGKLSFTLHVIGALLPKQEMIVTQWFHCDCIADYYGLEIFSEKHWDYIEKFMRTARENGINTILTPVFTPPLDTAVGTERKTVQLVDVTVTESGYRFGFERFERFVEMAKNVGMDHFEISHFYTQWGAKHAPKVMGTDRDGKYRRLFGWETDALSDEYREFLRAFIKALLPETEKLGILDKCLFHISDEPNEEQLESYKAAKAQIADLLEGKTIMDALSSFEFYRSGAVETPIPANNHIQPFIDANVSGLWTYYCCSQGKDVSNRFIAMPTARTRIIGLQFYKYNIVGFLQWGYNYYYSQYSLRLIDPYLITDGEYFYPAGDGFSVYPGPGGEALESLHLKGFTFALQDTRALALLESLTSREKVLSLMDPEGNMTFAEYPHSSEWLISLREGINRLIEEEL